jgi:SH3 domain-containing protein
VKTHASLSAAGGLLSLALSLAAGPLAGRAAPLTATAAVQTQPDPASPVVTYLKAGSEPVPAGEGAAPAPGWMAVDLPGPFEAYVQEKDFTKGLEVKPGSSLYLAPKAGAGVLTTAEKGDKIEITGLDGKWTQVRLDKHLVGYINTTPAAAAPAPMDLASAPAAGVAPAAPAVGQPAPTGETAASPRVLEGKFVSTHHFLSGHVPYDWALVDDVGSRLAYLDLSKLLLTEQPATYAGKSVVVSGSLQAGPDGKDVVLAVESLQLQ